MTSPEPSTNFDPPEQRSVTRTQAAWLAFASLFLGIVVAVAAPRLFDGQVEPESAERTATEDHEHAGEVWTCPMHPEVQEHESGSCPICGMDLVLDESAVASTPDTAPLDIRDLDGARPGGEQLWTCSMHPEVLQDEPGSCPICGMDLVPAASADAETSGGEAVVRIDPTVTQNMNVRSELAVRRDLTRPIRTVGYLDYDQQRMVTVTTKYSGWIERVYVNYVGEEVRRGQPLFEIYSPELVQTEEELLSALDFARQMEDAPEDARRRATSLVASARQRLKYWDVPEERIARLEQTGEVFRTLEIRSPSSGLVMMRKPSLEGMAVQPGMELFHIANLQSLWLSVELFEDQIAFVRPGTEAKIDLAYFPGESFTGRVRFLEPALSEETRTVSARIEVPNRGARLRKGMYATVELTPVAIRDALAVPSGSVLRTGRRNLVVVDLGEGRYVPREVTLGHEAGGFVQILAGLGEGERVLTSAQFLIDSESRLRSAVQQVLERRAASGDVSSAAAESAAQHQH